MARKDATKEALIELLKSSMGSREAAAVVHNHYGEAMERRANPPSGGGGGGGVMSQMGNKSGDDEKDDPFDYYVDINRTDKKDEHGNPVGWEKNVHRYRYPKDKPPPKKKRG